MACEVAGLAAPKRRDWVRKGLIDQPRVQAQLTELQTVELAVVRILHEALGARDAGVIWKQVHDAVLTYLLSDRIAVVVDLGYREAAVASTDSEILRLVLTGRAVIAIDLTETIVRVRAAFKRLTKSPSATRMSARHDSKADTAG